MTSCWRPPTSSRMAIRSVSRWFPTASRSARCITPRSTRTSSAPRPDLEVTVRLDVLQEIDGRADHLKPNRDFLAERYALFRRAS
jgi:hypothetical protein